MFTVRKGIHIDMAHHVGGHPGGCINIHGHTWLFEVTLEAHVLDDMGFVVDFGLLKRRVLEPAHRLLDHGLALYANRVQEAEPYLLGMGKVLMGTRPEKQRFYTANDGLPGQPQAGYAFVPPGESLNGAQQMIIGGMKIAAFPFSPTSELLAEWLYGLAAIELEDGRVRVKEASIYETLHPVHAVASYSRNRKKD